MSTPENTPPPAPNTPQSPNTPNINDFLNEAGTYSRELLGTIKESVSKAMSQGAKLAAANLWPLFDVYETADAVILRSSPIDSAIPASVEISMTGDQLTVKVLTTAEGDIEGAHYLQRERTFGEFSRTIQIPRAVLAQQAEAHLARGILTIKLPKDVGSGSQVIKVQNLE
jgi:HSP20 family protein